jgi:hypothetical protein
MARKKGCNALSRRNMAYGERRGSGAVTVTAAMALRSVHLRNGAVLSAAYGMWRRRGSTRRYSAKLFAAYMALAMAK